MHAAHGTLPAGLDVHPWHMPLLPIRNEWEAMFGHGHADHCKFRVSHTQLQKHEENMILEKLGAMQLGDLQCVVIKSPFQIRLV